MPDLGQWISSQRSEVFGLEPALELEPLIPSLVERLAEDVAELACVKGLAVVRAAEPFDSPLRPVGKSEIGEEAGAVEVAVGPDLEICRRAFAFEPERREDPDLVADLRRQTISSYAPWPRPSPPAIQVSKKTALPSIYQRGVRFRGLVRKL